MKLKSPGLDALASNIYRDKSEKAEEAGDSKRDSARRSQEEPNARRTANTPLGLSLA